MVAIANKSEGDKEMDYTTNPSYEVMRLHQPTFTQRGSDEREDYVTLMQIQINQCRGHNIP